MMHDKPTSFLRVSASAVLALGMTFAAPVRAALYSQDFDGEASTFGQRGAVQVTATGHGITFRVANIDFLTERMLGGLAVNFVPTKLKLSSITVYDFEAALTQENFATTPAMLSGETLSVSANGIERGEKDSVAFTTTEGTTLRGTPVTFSFAEAPELDTGKTYTLTFNFAKAATPVLLGFSNTTTTADADRGDFRFTGGVASAYAPHLALKGTAFVNRFVLDVGEGVSVSLKDLLAKEMKDGKTFETDYDIQDTVVAVNLQPGAQLTLDQPIANAAFVGASFAETQPLLSPETEVAPPTLTFVKEVAMTGPFSLRGGTGTGAGAETVVGTPMVANVCLAGDTSAWNPTDFMLRTDLRAECFFPTVEGNWFKAHSLPIASGRRLVRAAPGESPSQTILPELLFEAADSTLVLARPYQDTQSGDIPERFREALRNASGTLYFARNATVSADSKGGVGALTVGQNGLTHTFGLMTEGKTLAMDADVPLVLGDGAGASGTFRQHAGTVELNAVTLAQDGAALGQFLQDAGTATMGDVAFPATGEAARFRVGDGVGGAETARVTAESLTGGTGTGTVSVEVLADGRLEAGEISLAGARHTMTLRGGTLAASKDTDAKVDAGTAGVRVAGDGMLDANGGTLSIAAITGEGDLAAKGNVTLATLQNYTGRVEQKGTSGTLTLGQILGTSGTVTVGHLGYATDALALEAITKAATDYRGTLAFGAEKKIYDFSDLRDVTTFPYALAFSNGQTITMRLDQYADATIRWPENPQGITLTLIEAGAYGGVAEIPHVPEGINVKFFFKRYAGDGAATLEDVGNYTRTPNENGVTDSLTWESPLFTGKGAWIDCEFNGTSANTGWFRLKGKNGDPDEDIKDEYNGLLYGVDKPYVVFTSSTRPDCYVASRHPKEENGSVTFTARPFVELPSLLYPEQWSVAVRFTTPNAGGRCLLAMGANSLGPEDKTALPDFPDANLNTFLLATGEDGNHIQLWYVQGNNDDSATLVAEARVSNATTGAYVVSAVCDGNTLKVYLDGNPIATYPRDTPDTPNVPTKSPIRLGPGLQVGQMLGGNRVNRALWSQFSPVEEVEGGAIDYLRFYKGALTDTAMAAMANETPHIVRNVRFVRDVTSGGLWVDSDTKPWTKQFYTDGVWVDGDTYAEPEEGTEVRLRVAGGDHLLQVNVKRDTANCFYSADRTYATLVVEPQDGATAAGTLRLVPAGVTDANYETANTAWTANNDWFTKMETDGTFTYGRLRFSGGAGDPICDDPTIPNFHGAGYLLSGGTRSIGTPTYGETTGSSYNWTRTGTRTGTRTVTYTSGHGVKTTFDAGCCWFSNLAPMVLMASQTGTETQTVTQTQSSLSQPSSWPSPSESEWNVSASSLDETQPNVLTLVAGLSLTRGVEDEAKTWQLTGPITVEGAVPEGGDAVAGNPTATVPQASKDVWVAAANDAAKWTFFDRTLTKAENANGAKQGLFAQGIQTPGRLYLDLTHADTAAKYREDKAFSKQAWYRYGYPTTEAGDTLSGMEPKAASASDFSQAVAFQVKLGGDAELTLDAVPEATVRTFYVEPANTTANAPTLALRSQDDKRLAITKSVVAAARLNVANGATADALNLSEGVEIHRGGTDKGAYVVGNQDFTWPLDASSVPRLEVAEGGTLTFSAAQDLHEYQVALVAHQGATLALPGAATLRAEALTLAKGATFRFAEGDVTFDGAVRLDGAATLEGTGAQRQLTAVGGLMGTDAVPALTVSATETADWSLKGTLSHLALTKTGTGTVDFPEASSPAVEGMVRVEAGTLKVGTTQIPAEDAHDAPTIGHYGLHVAADATLARTANADANGVIACIPEEQTLSGAGTIAGLLRLNRGATYDGARGFGLKVNGVVTGTSGETDIAVNLPADYAEDTPFLTALREERTVRRRLLSTVGTETWNTKGVIDRTDAAQPKTLYSATRPGLPVPAYDAGTAWGGTEGNAYDPAVAEALIASHRRANIASVSSAKGYTKAGTYGLNATEISNAYRCFNGIWAFAPDGNPDTTREVLDSSALCMAYEFGISRLTILAMEGVQETLPEGIRRTEQGYPLYVVVEASLRQDLKARFNFAEGSEAATQTASFAPGVTLELRKDDGKTTLDAIELDAFGGKPVSGTTPSGANVRWFAIPYTEKNFPMGTIYLTVHAIAPTDHADQE